MVTDADSDDDEVVRRAGCLRAAAYAFARHHALDDTDAEDAAEDAVVRMLEATGGTLLPPPEVHNLEAWLRGCARRRVIDYLRRAIAEQGHRAASPEPNDQDGALFALETRSVDRTPEEDLLRAEARHAVVAAIDALERREHLDFIDARLIDVPVEQIAVETGRTPSAIYKELARTRAHLRHLLEEQGWTEADVRRALLPPALPAPRSPRVSQARKQTL